MHAAKAQSGGDDLAGRHESQIAAEVAVAHDAFEQVVVKLGNLPACRGHAQSPSGHEAARHGVQSCAGLVVPRLDGARADQPLAQPGQPADGLRLVDDPLYVAGMGVEKLHVREAFVLSEEYRCVSCFIRPEAAAVALRSVAGLHRVIELPLLDLVALHRPSWVRARRRGGGG